MPPIMPPTSGDLTAENIREVIQDDSIYVQQKLDGHFLTVAVSSQIDFFTKNDQRYSRSVHHSVREDLAKFQDYAKRAGVVIMFNGEYLDETYHVFDVDLGPSFQRGILTPWSKREETYASLIEEAGTKHVRAVTTAKTAPEKTRLILELMRGGAEGFVAKTDDTAVKYKFIHDVDVMVIRHREGKDSVEVGVFDAARKIVHVIGACSTIGKGAIEPGDVLTVTYLYVGPNGRLVQPRIKERREDKGPLECTVDQLAHDMSKAVVSWQISRK